MSWLKSPHLAEFSFSRVRNASRRQGPSFLHRLLERRPGGIRFKLAAVTLALIALITIGFSLVVIRVLDDALMHALLQRGNSLTLAAATPAGYSILADDLLALDNLAAKIVQAQDDVTYLAILDPQKNILAHSSLGARGESFEGRSGNDIAATDESIVRKVFRDGFSTYEFRSSIEFAGRRVGEVVVGIDSAAYEAAKVSARRRMTWISMFVLGAGLGGTLLLSARFTRPIERLSAGVSRISRGDYDVQVEPASRDELAELTISFNGMARTIRAQKENLEGAARELEEAYVATVRILAAALDARDNYTLNHSARVASLSLRVGRRLGLGKGELRDLEIACFLHDIGKIRVPDSVLNKPGPLDPEEASLIRRHPEEGADILGLAQSLHRYVPVVRHHHEWYDGSGYPEGLSGEEIPLFAQIVSIADAYDAMTSSRPYRPGRSVEEGIAEIREFSGRQFSPRLAELFVAAVQEEAEEELSFMGAGL